MLSLPASLAARLTVNDDPALWEVILDTLLKEFAEAPAGVVVVGCCSHWVAPHHWRWIPPVRRGLYAAPYGYGRGTGWRGGLLPQFDWFETFWRDESTLTPLTDNTRTPTLRIAVPARTIRRLRASIHVQTMLEGKRRFELFGFRRARLGWKLGVSTVQLARLKKMRRRKKRLEC